MRLRWLSVAIFITGLRAEMNVNVELLARAARTGDLKLTQSLLEDGMDPNARDRNGKTPLYYASAFEEAKTVELLLAHHADPNAQAERETDSPVTPLQFAAHLGNLRIAGALIAAGGQLNTQGPKGRTALHFATQAGHLDLIRYLLEKGADIAIRDAEGTSALDEAIWRRDLDGVAILLANGGRLNEPQAKTGATPINEAAFLGDNQIINYLLQFGPDLDKPDDNGYDPAENAARRGNESAAVLLFEAKTKLHTRHGAWGKLTEIAIKEDESTLLTAILQNDDFLDRLLPSGSTPLAAAVTAGSAKATQVLLDHGADPNRGKSLLEEGALRGHRRIVELLLEHGAQINELNADSGTTALYAAASFGKGDVVSLLLTREADPNLCGKGHKTPYQAALDNGYGEIADEIRRHGGSKNCKAQYPE